MVDNTGGAVGVYRNGFSDQSMGVVMVENVGPALLARVSILHRLRTELILTLIVSSHSPSGISRATRAILTGVN